MAKFLSEQDFIFHRIDGSSDSDNAIIKDTALILNQEWPNIKLQSRFEWLSRSSINNLPASWVLLNTDNNLLENIKSTPIRNISEFISSIPIQTNILATKIY